MLSVINWRMLTVQFNWQHLQRSTCHGKNFFQVQSLELCSIWRPDPNSRPTQCRKELLKTVKAKKLAYYGHTMRKQWSCLEKQIMQGTLHAGEEDHAQPGWTTSRRGHDSLWKSHSEWHRTEINGESTFMAWPTLESKEQDRTM